jgi:hypothetical protein
VAVDSRGVTSAVILLMLGTTIWVGFDARSRDWSDSSFADQPWKWVVGCLLLWIVVFPVYLVKRGQAGRASPVTPIASPPSAAQPPPGWTAEQMAAAGGPSSPSSGGNVNTLTGVLVIMGFVIVMIVVLVAMSGHGDSTASSSVASSAATPTPVAATDSGVGPLDDPVMQAYANCAADGISYYANGNKVGSLEDGGILLQGSLENYGYEADSPEANSCMQGWVDAIKRNGGIG